MVTAVLGRLRQGWRAVLRRRFWLLAGLAIGVGVVGDARLRGWWSQAIPFLALWWPWLLIGLAAAAIVLRLAWWLWWWLPKQQVDRLRLPDALTCDGGASQNFFDSRQNRPRSRLFASRASRPNFWHHRDHDHQAAKRAQRA